MRTNRFPMVFTIDDDQGVVFVSAFDATTLDACVDAALEVVCHPAYWPSYDVLIDCRRMHRLPTVETIRTIAEMWRRKPADFRGRCALLVASAAAYGLGRTFEVVSGASDQFCTFREETQALGWLECAWPAATHRVSA